MKLWKISGPLLFALIAVSNAVEVKNQEMHFRSLDEAELVFMVSVGYFSIEDYRHMCFANMILLDYAYTASFFLKFEGEFWVRARKHHGENCDSFSRIVDYKCLNDYLRKKHPAQAENFPDTQLAVIKLEKPIDVMRLPESFPIYVRNEEYEISRVIGYMDSRSDNKFSWDKIVEYDVRLDNSRSNQHLELTDRFYIRSSSFGSWITVRDRGSVVLNDDSVIVGIISDVDKPKYPKNSDENTFGIVMKVSIHEPYLRELVEEMKSCN